MSERLTLIRLYGIIVMSPVKLTDRQRTQQVRPAPRRRPQMIFGKLVRGEIPLACHTSQGQEQGPTGGFETFGSHLRIR